jgi:hypothetical protein
MTRGVKLSILVALFAYLIARTNFWTWFIFTLDYFLGNPSFFYDYRTQLMEEMAGRWPVRKDGIRIPSQPFQELYGENFTHQTFKHVSEGYTRPLIIRGLFKDAPAMKWTPEYLAESIGDDRQFVAFSDNSIGVGRKGASTFMTTLKDAVKNISAGGNNYLFNSNLEYPIDLKLYQEIGADRIAWKPPVLVQFFLGLTRVGETRLGGSPLHAAVAPNINIQLSGEKTWIMIDPKYVGYVKPTLLSDQVAVFAGASWDYGAADRWHNFPRFESVVRPGDAIFIPSWWLHEVQNLPGPEWQLSLAIRYTNLVSSFWNNWLFSALVDLGTRHKPCWPGFRLICFEFGAWEQTYQRQSMAALEMNKRAKETEAREAAKAAAAAGVRNYE